MATPEDESVPVMAAQRRIPLGLTCLRLTAYKDTMRIVLENGSPELTNLGDFAMLQVAYERIRRRWPGALVHVVTRDPAILAELLPGSTPVVLPPITAPSGPRAEFRRLISRLTPADLKRHLQDRRVRRMHTKVKPELIRLIEEADAVIAVGGGYLTDSFVGVGTSILHSLLYASALGRSTALFGQGLGPARNPVLIKSLREVLNTADVIALRERTLGPGLVRAIGGQPERLRVTGDDAIDVSYRSRPSELGTGLGLNIRIARYSGAEGHLEKLRDSALAGIATELGSTWTVLPILVDSRAGETDEMATLTTMSRLGLPLPMRRSSARTTGDLLAALASCRVVVTGSYHAGVFALSQGIPVIGLVFSDYYAGKFSGLANMFGEGAFVFDVRRGQAGGALAGLIREAWNQAPDVRNSLLRAAVSQMRASELAYEEFFELVESRRQTPEMTPEFL